LINSPQLRPDKNRDAHWECNAKDNQKTLKTGEGGKKETEQRETLRKLTAKKTVKGRTTYTYLTARASRSSSADGCCKTL